MQRTRNNNTMKDLILIIFFVPFILNAQTENKLSFDFGVGINSYNMDSLNTNYIDSFAMPNKIFEDKIQDGKTFFLAIKYHPHSLFDIGIYGNYQFGESKYEKEISITDDFGYSYVKHSGNHTLKTEALSFGLINNWYINYILKLQEKKSKFLQNSKIVTELNLGYGFSKITMDFIYPSYKLASSYYFFTARGYQGKIALKYEYEYLKSPIIGTIGFKIGYQYFVTNNVKDKYNEDWKVLNSEPINLDFSGIYYSVYMSFGK